MTTVTHSPNQLDCFYSLSSPWAYLVGPRLASLVEHFPATTLVLKPYDFQRIAPLTGGVPIRTRPLDRRRYHTLELDRWRTYLGMPLNLEPKHYPEDVIDENWNKRPGWMLIAAQRHEAQRGLDAQRLSHALLRGLWAEERDIADAAVRCKIADEHGFDGAALLTAETSPEVQAAYVQYTEEARQLGVFGSPTFVWRGELFWGQDRLEFVERAIARDLGQ